MSLPESNKTTWVSTSAEIDLTTWDWGDGYDDGFAGLIMKGCAMRITEVLRETFEEYPPDISFPCEWVDSDGRGGGAVTDPAMLYVDLPLGSSSDVSCSYALSLEGCVDDLIELNVSHDTRKIHDARARRMARKLAGRLRELADKLDNACVPTEGLTDD